MLLRSISRVVAIKHERVEKKFRTQGDAEMSKSKKSRGRSYVAPESSLSCTPASVQQSQSANMSPEFIHPSKWDNMPPELLLDIIRRVDAGCTSWPGRRDVVACAGVCKSWRETVKQVVRTPEQCGLFTFPRSLKQPGPRDAPIQCFIRRDKATSIYRLYLGLSPDVSGNACKLLLVAKKVKHTTRTYFLISLGADDFSTRSNNYMGRIRSNIFGNKFSMYDSQPWCKSALESSGCFPENSTSEKLSSRYPVAAITYELNLLRSRGPRRMLCKMDTIPVAAIREGGNVPTPVRFSSGPQGKLKTQATTPGLTRSLGGNENSRTPLVLKNQAPRWHEQLRCWCLNFNGRVTVASVKNFQLVAALDSLQDATNTQTDRVVLQFGKMGKDVFTMDFCYPLSLFQALAISLSSFDTKLACE